MQIINLVNTIANADETMDELSEKIKRVITIVKFIFIGPFILLACIPLSGLKFFINLYYEPNSK
jgi:hypothetical protein